MESTTLLDEVIIDFEAIAAKHKKDLGSTRMFVHWNTFSMQLFKLALNFSSGGDNQTLADSLDTIIKGSFAELEDEIPRMVDINEQAAALVLYQRMHDKLEEFKCELVPHSPSPNMM